MAVPDAYHWGPEWIPLPWGGAMHKADMGPCGDCGEVVFHKYERPSGGMLFPGCRRCIRPRREDVLIGSINVRTGEVRDFRSRSRGVA